MRTTLGLNGCTSNMSAIQNRRRRRRSSGRAGVRRACVTRPIREQPESIDVDSIADVSTCIDLTEEEEEVVDLTAVPESPVVVIPGTPTDASGIRDPRRHNRSESVEILEIPPYPQVDVVSRVGLRNISSESGGGESTSSGTGSPISCPVCLDNYDEIKSSGRSLYSTNCGHVFCNVCILGSISTQHRCPTCRKKLTARQIHHLFI